MAKPLTSSLASIEVVNVRGGHFATRQEDLKRAWAVHDTIVASLPQFPVGLPFFGGTRYTGGVAVASERSDRTALMVKGRRCILTLGQEAS